MSDLITDEIFTDGQSNIAASNMNGIIGRARAQPDLIANKVASSTLNVADQMLILKTDNTLARARFDTIVNSTSSSLPVADATKNGMLRQVSGKATDFVDGTNNCQPIANLLPPGMVVDYAGPNIPSGWFLCNGQLVSRTLYSGLFSAIGTTYGAGDGSTTFAVPNFQGRVAAGAGGSFGALGVLGGAATVVLAVGNMPSHSHSITDKVHSHTATASDSGHTHNFTAVLGAAGGSYQGGNPFSPSTATTQTGFANVTVSVAGAATGITATNAAGSGTAFSILNPYIAVYKIIKQ